MQMSEFLFLIAAVAAAMAAVFAWATMLWGGSERLELTQQVLRAKDREIGAKEREIGAKEREIASLRRELESQRTMTPSEANQGLTAALSASTAWARQLEEQVEALQETLARYETSEIGRAAEERERIKRGLSEVAERFNALNRAVAALQAEGLQGGPLEALTFESEPDRPGRRGPGPIGVVDLRKR